MKETARFGSTPIPAAHRRDGNLMALDKFSTNLTLQFLNEEKCGDPSLEPHSATAATVCAPSSAQDPFPSRADNQKSLQLLSAAVFYLRADVPLVSNKLADLSFTFLH